MDQQRGLRNISFNHVYTGPAGIQVLAELGHDENEIAALREKRFAEACAA